MAITDYIFSQLLNCGSLDIDFIDRLEEDFGEWNGWDNLRERIIDEQIDANTIIYEIFYDSLAEICEELEIKIEDIDYDIFTNCLDSHLHIYDADRNTTEMYDKEDIREFLENNYIHLFDRIETIEDLEHFIYEKMESDEGIEYIISESLHFGVGENVYTYKEDAKKAKGQQPINIFCTHGAFSYISKDTIKFFLWWLLEKEGQLSISDGEQTKVFDLES